MHSEPRTSTTYSQQTHSDLPMNVHSLPQNSKAIEMFMDHLDFAMKPWEIDDPETGKRDIYVENKIILSKRYRQEY